MNNTFRVILVLIAFLGVILIVLKLARASADKVAARDRKKLLEILPESEFNELNKINPYRAGLEEGRKFQYTWANGWIRGKYYACQKIIDYARKNKTPKEEVRPLLEFILGYELPKDK